MEKKIDDPWQAQSDAETLHRASQITGDKSRHKAAQMHIKQMAKAVGLGSKPPAISKPKMPSMPKMGKMKGK